MKILKRDQVKTLERSVLQYYRHHCTKILKTSNIEELKRGLVKTLRGLSIAVSDNRLSAELLIPSTLPQANYVLLIFFILSIIVINHLTPSSPTISSSSSSSSSSPSSCFISLFQTQIQISLRIYLQLWTFTREFAVSLVLSCLLCMFRRARVPLVWCYQGIGPSRLLA